MKEYIKDEIADEIAEEMETEDDEMPARGGAGASIDEETGEETKNILCISSYNS